MDVGFFQLAFVSIGLAADASSVALALGAAGYIYNFRSALKPSFHFGLFQFIMPVIGWAAGVTVVDWIAPYDHWVAFILLAFIGFRMILSSRENPNSKALTYDPTRYGALILLSIATSIDALALGLSLAIFKINILIPSIFIGIITFISTLLFAKLGGSLGMRFGRKMEISGGLILILIGIHILLSHLGWI